MGWQVNGRRKAQTHVCESITHICELWLSLSPDDLPRKGLPFSSPFLDQTPLISSPTPSLYPFQPSACLPGRYVPKPCHTLTAALSISILPLQACSTPWMEAFKLTRPRPSPRCSSRMCGVRWGSGLPCSLPSMPGFTSGRCGTSVGGEGGRRYVCVGSTGDPAISVAGCQQ